MSTVSPFPSPQSGQDDPGRGDVVDQESCWPFSWLTPWRLDDAAAGRAYEETPPALRAEIKTAIALQCALEGEAPAESDIRTTSRTAGFYRRETERPAAWTLAVIDPAHAAPARLLAALAPAVLAGVERILIIAAGGVPSPAVCVALELAGLEDVFVLPALMRDAPPPPRHSEKQDAPFPEHPAPADVLIRLHDGNPDGRLLLFPTEKSLNSPFFAFLRRLARDRKIRIWQDSPAPRLLLAGSDNPRREEVIRWAHGDGVLERRPAAEAFPPAAREAGWDAVYVDEAPATLPVARVFGPGLEACWRNRETGIRFFRSASLAATFC